MSDEHQWRHGWVPLTLHAAILKAHGNHDRAEELLRAARKRRHRSAARRPDFVTPNPAYQAAHAERVRLRSMSDDQIATAMGAADDAQLAHLVAELERRDRTERKAAAARDRRGRRRQEHDDAKQAEAERLIAGGEDEAEAYRRAYGYTEDQERRQEAIAFLRSSGYRGRGLDQLIRAAHQDHAREEYARAEDEGRGEMLNKAGKRAGISSKSLFTGPESRARKYASEELMGYWEEHGRMTADDFRAGVLGGKMRHKGAASYA